MLGLDKLFQKKIKIDLKPGKIKPVVLLSIDGFGIAPPSNGNAVTLAKTPNYTYLLKNFPNGQLIASGESVGLPANEEGNSEVGHLTMGVGRVIFQSLMRIRASIEDNSFYDIPAFIQAIDHVNKNNSSLHILGLVSSGEVHASIDHFYALIELAKKREVKKVFLHIITDGRDAPPHEAKSLITEIKQKLKATPQIKISTISGRYYSMDRDQRWERTKMAYEAMVMGKGQAVTDPTQAIDAIYAQEKTDEFVVPSVVYGPDQKPVGLVQNNDAVIFFNFRIDRPRELAMAFTMKDFENLEGFTIEERDEAAHHIGKRTEKKQITISGPTFKREHWPQNLYFVTMTEYQKNIPVSAIAFPPIIVRDPLAKILADNGMAHYHLAESEKERMVTYYNGMTDEQIPLETIKIVDSPKVSTYDKKPQMSTPQIVEAFIKALKEDKYTFYIINFACTDMVAHTGKLKPSIKAVEAADKGLGQIAQALFMVDGTFLISADHGNVEELISYPTGSFYFTTSQGSVDTSHSNNPVPIVIANNSLKGKPIKIPQGSLSDIAPTILNILNLPVPPTMTGKYLLEGLI
jgi:2,3-bisphosphoglycerate-independent phosphoglycerate mutase